MTVRNEEQMKGIIINNGEIIGLVILVGFLVWCVVYWRFLNKG